MPLIKRLVYPKAAGVEKPREGKIIREGETLRNSKTFKEGKTLRKGETPKEKKCPLLEKLIKDVKYMLLYSQIADYARR
jgi:hypothetical protein